MSNSHWKNKAEMAKKRFLELQDRFNALCEEHEVLRKKWEVLRGTIALIRSHARSLFEI